MATLDSARLLGHHLKVIGDSGIRDDQLQSLHSSGVFSTLLHCSEPYRVDREALRHVLLVREEPLEELRNLCRKKLRQAAQAREKRNMFSPNNWYDCMKEASALLRRIYHELSNVETVLDPMTNKRVDAMWRPLSDRYHAEACALLLLEAYGRTCELDEAPSLFREAMKNSVPCDICNRSGTHYGLQCLACKGTKQLPTHVVTCSDCGGSGEGDAYIPSCGGLGVCGHCIDSGAGAPGKVVVDSFNRMICFDAVYICKLLSTL